MRPVDTMKELTVFVLQFESMKGEVFQVEELAKAKSEKPKRLGELAAKEWREIDDGTKIFDRPDQEAAALRKLEKDELLTFFKVCAT